MIAKGTKLVCLHDAVTREYAGNLWFFYPENDLVERSEISEKNLSALDELSVEVDGVIKGVPDDQIERWSKKK